jgi:DNA ligase-associated metallophosphoesterase
MELMVAGQHLLFLPERALIWKEASALLLADLHIGKAGHFRKHGIGLPGGAVEKDIGRLRQLIENHKPAEVILLGDLYHSSSNKEWAVFSQFLDTQTNVSFMLVPGNHDRHFLKSARPPSLRITETMWLRPPFALCHEPSAIAPNDHIKICGHLHPGVTLSGKARMRETLPCFWLKPTSIVLPAFGTLTGLSKISPAAGDQVIAIAGNSCLRF